MQQAVADSVRRQVLRLAAAQDRLLQDAGDLRPAASRLAQVHLALCWAKRPCLRPNLRAMPACAGRDSLW